MILSNNSKMIQCDVCDFEVAESDWDTHIDTATHKNGALLQIIKDRIDHDDHNSNDDDNDTDDLLDTRDETAEFLEELQQDFSDDKL